jgi:molybdopterin converting factor small subunit
VEQQRNEDAQCTSNSLIVLRAKLEEAERRSTELKDDAEFSSKMLLENAAALAALNAKVSEMKDTAAERTGHQRWIDGIVVAALVGILAGGVTMMAQLDSKLDKAASDLGSKIDTAGKQWELTSNNHTVQLRSLNESAAQLNGQLQEVARQLAATSTGTPVKSGNVIVNTMTQGNGQLSGLRSVPLPLVKYH